MCYWMEDKLSQYFSKLLNKECSFEIDKGDDGRIIRYQTDSFTLKELSKATNQKIRKIEFFSRHHTYHCRNIEYFGYFELEDEDGWMHPKCIINQDYAITRHPYQHILDYDSGLYLVVLNEQFVNEEPKDYKKLEQEKYEKIQEEKPELVEQAKNMNALFNIISDVIGGYEPSSSSSSESSE